MKKGEYPAFPTTDAQKNCETGYGLESCSGMTKRYYTAVHILPTVIIRRQHSHSIEAMVEEAYKFTDELLKQEKI